MKEWHCPCLGLIYFGSDPPAECYACTECGMNCYAKLPAPHELRPYYNSLTGEKQSEFCLKCFRWFPLEHPVVMLEVPVEKNRNRCYRCGHYHHPVSTKYPYCGEIVSGGIWCGCTVVVVEP